MFEEFKTKLDEFVNCLFVLLDDSKEQQQMRNDLSSIQECFVRLSEEYNHQKIGNEILLKEISKLKFARGVDSVLLSFHQRNLNAAVADLLIHPNPVEIKCTHKNVSVTYKVGVNDILLIKSRGRTKLIYLKKKFRPLEGGDEQEVIMVNKNRLDFDELLRMIQ